MARPRQPAQILELRGAYKAHPERRRQDAEGAGEFNREPPEHLRPDVARAWRYVVSRLPLIALTSSDEVCVEQAARVLSNLWAMEQRMGDLCGSLSEFKALNDALARWLGLLGMTPASRANFAAAPRERKPNGFAKLRDMGNDL
jgi:phage terminase small subunit